jgi:serine/threonine-protein kinase
VRTFGKYRLLEPLASGGMADVWRAEVPLAAGVVKEVALKLVRGDHQANGDFVRMFVEEARLACRLGHANVVQVFEFDRIDGRYYLAMELVRGHHLGLVVERAREAGLRLGLPRTVHVIAEAAKALAYVHRVHEGGRPLGLVHRDVSPHNLLVSFEGEVKLADFGIARAMSLAGITEPGTLKGKIAYMAPEQAAGEPVDARADVFSLGVILWELCAGRRLFARDSEAATLAAVLSGPPPSSLRDWNEEVSPALDAIALGALERDPARRTSSAEELEKALSAELLRIAQSPQDWDLRTFMHRLWPQGASPAAGAGAQETLVRPPEAAAGVPGPRAGPEPGLEAEPTSPTRTIAGLARRRGRLLAVALAAAVLVAGGVTTVRWRGPQPAAETPGASGLAAGRSPEPAHAPAPDTPPANPGAAAVAPAPTGSHPVDAAAALPSTPSPTPSGTGSAPPPASDPDRATPAGDAARPEAPGDGGDRRMGVLYVNATPWARITVDDRPAGETPLTLSLPPGRHRRRAAHPSYGSDRAVVEIRAGRRATWMPALHRE